LDPSMDWIGLRDPVFKLVITAAQLTLLLTNYDL